MLTKLHAGGKFGGGGYKFSGGLHGVAYLASTLFQNGLTSRWLKMENFTRDFHRGVAQRPWQVGNTNNRGTTINVFP